MSIKIPKLTFNDSLNAPINTGEKAPALKPETSKLPELRQGINGTPESKGEPVKKSGRFFHVTTPIIEAQPVPSPLKFIEKYINKAVIKNAIEQNPEITRILNEKGLKPEISQRNMDGALKRHLFTTYVAAMNIIEQANNNKENTIDKDTARKIAQAALIHDIGKALIPESIIQKEHELTPEEQEIVNLHTILGAEILKTTDIDPDVIEAVAKHHYSSNQEKSETTKISEIVSVADVYSALKEKRPYKESMKDKEVFQLMFNIPKLRKKYVENLYLQQH